MTGNARTAVDGSAPDHSGTRSIAAADPATPMRVTIVLRPPDSSQAAELLSGRYDVARHVPSALEDGVIAAVEAFAREMGLAIVQSSAATRTVVVTGSAAQMSDAFGVRLASFQGPDGAQYLSHEGSVTVPAEIAPSALAVLGLDERARTTPR